MKTEEELLKIIKDNEYFLPADSDARFVFFDKENDEVVIEVNARLGSPKVNDEGEIIEPCFQKLRYALRLKFKFSDLFLMGEKAETVIRYINHPLGLLEESKAREEKLAADLKEAREEAFDLYHQACCVECLGDKQATYDNQCMSTYECVEDKLIEWGMLKPEQCLRRIYKKEEG